MATMNALKGLLRWARTSRDGDDAATLPVQQVEYLGKLGDAVAWFPYGFHACVPADELALLLSLQGNPEARVALPGSPRQRPRVASGEVVVFHPETGAEIHFLASGDVEVTSPTRVKVTAPLVDVVSAIKATVTAPLVDVVSATKVTITAPAAEVVGNLTVTGNLVVTGTATNLGVNIGSTHVHGGVTAGAGVSGVPQ